MLQSQMLETQDNLFQCVLKNSRILLCLLQAISLNEDIVILFSEKGIQFTSEKNKSFQITVYLQRELFSSFKVPEESIGLKLPIKIFIDSLTSMLTCTSHSEKDDDKDNTLNLNAKNDVDTSLEIIYNDFGQPLILVLKDDISVTECSLSPQDSENIISYEMKNENLLSRIIIQSDFFKEVLSELNLNSDNLQINVDPDYGIVLVTSGDGVTSTKKIPKTSPKLINYEFQELHTHTYKTKFIKMCMKAINQSTKTCIKIDSNGLLNIEYMVTLFNDNRCFVQTYTLPNVD